MIEIDLPFKLQDIRERGWMTVDKNSDSGIGDTLERLLGIARNNSRRPDCIYGGKEVEIKSHRIRSNSMISLFALEPGTKVLDDADLIRKYGYNDKKGRLALSNDLSCKGYNAQGLKLAVDPSEDAMLMVDKEDNAVWAWEISRIDLKLLNLCLVHVDTRRSNGKLEFRIEKAELMEGLDNKSFFELLENGFVVIDLRMHLKDSGAVRNHGTAFRAKSWDMLKKCYSSVKLIA